MLPLVSMRTFTIGEVEQLCGIRAHTLRTWEQRYGLVRPGRTNGKTRIYSTDEVEDLLCFCLLNRNGYRISAIAAMSAADRKRAMEGLTESGQRKERAVHSLVVAMNRLDVSLLSNTLEESFLSWSLAEVTTQVIYPFLQKVDLLYEGRQRTAEHIVVGEVRKKLLWAIERTEGSLKTQKNVLLFVPHARQLDLLLLYLYFRFKSGGWNVVYLGTDVSSQNLDEMLRHESFDYLFTYAPLKSRNSFSKLSEMLSQLQPRSRLVVIDDGPLSKANQLPNTETVNRKDLEDYLLLLQGKQDGLK